MGFLNKVRETIVGGWAGASLGVSWLRASADALEESHLRERAGDAAPSLSSPDIEGKISGVMEHAFAELELAFEDVGWRGIGGEYGMWNFTRQTLKRITALSRVMYLMNPLIRRAVTVQELYVWGRGCQIKAESPEVQEVLDDFFTDRKNQRVIGCSWAEREREQRIDGNTFFVFFINKITGACRIRLLPFDQVENIIFNPEDAKEPRFYARVWSGTMNAPGLSGIPDEPLDQKGMGRMYYPDIDYDPTVKPSHHPDGTEINWNTRIFHLKTGGLSMMRFGIPELFSALNWATAYKKILENFASILAAHARLAMQITGNQGKKGNAAAKNKLNTGLNSGRFLDNNPSNNTAGWFLSSGNMNVMPIKTANSTTAPGEARALRSMVSSGTDTPEHFFGDSEVGSYATSSTLDRPTELKMVCRQNTWGDVIVIFSNFLIEQSARAPRGKLKMAGYKADIQRDSFDGSLLVMITPPEGKNTKVVVEFPNILERDVTDRVRSVVQAVTLGGSKAEGIIPNRKLVCQLLLEALGQENADRMTDILYPKDVIQGFVDPADVQGDDHLTAQGRKELGDAALIAAKNKPAPGTAKPSGAPVGGGRSGN